MGNEVGISNCCLSSVIFFWTLSAGPALRSISFTMISGVRARKDSPSTSCVESTERNVVGLTLQCIALFPDPLRKSIFFFNQERASLCTSYVLHESCMYSSMCVCTSIHLHTHSHTHNTILTCSLNTSVHSH